MGFLIKILLISLPVTMLSNNECKLMPDGSYVVKYPYDSIYSEIQLKIRKGGYKIKRNNGDTETGKLIWVYECQFKLKPHTPPKEDTTRLVKEMLKSFGEPIFELQDKKGDTLFFRTTFSGNLHLTTSQGYMLKTD
jgi:hypothetical protein